MSITILLVEDENLKQQTINTRLQEISTDLKISFASNVKEAKRELKAARFDLLIIDLVIPLSDLAPRPSRTGGLALLEWLEDEDRKPGYVVGMSSFTDVADEQAAEFSDRSWCVLRYDPASDLVRATPRTGSTYSGSEAPNFRRDIPIGCACGYCASQARIGCDSRARLEVQSNSPTCEGRQFVRSGHKQLASGQQIKVSAGSTSKMGMVWTALFVSNAIKQLRPRVVAMTGICMRHPVETMIGDIVVAVHSWNWQAGRLSARKDGTPLFEIQPEPVVASKVLTNLWDDMAADSALLDKIHREFNGDKPSLPPKLKVAPMVSGSVVIAHHSVHKDIFDQDRKIRAVDMETFGVYAACESIEDLAPLFVSVKCVSDLGLPDKEDKYQNYCAYASARALDLFLEKYWGTVMETIQRD